MSNKKIKLFFEDKIDPDNPYDEEFARLIKVKLPSEYEISKAYGRIHLQNVRERILSFSHTHNLENAFTPQKNLKKDNERSKWNLKEQFKDDIPFFVIDTDGMGILNVKKLLSLSDKGPFKTPDIIVHGNPPLLASLLSDCSKFRGISAWGLVLLNPNEEGIKYKSLKIDDDNIDRHLFIDKDEFYLKFNWLFAGNEKKRCFFNYNENAFRKPATQISIVKDIWTKIPEVKDIFKDKISTDISEYRFKLVDDGIISQEHLNPRLLLFDNMVNDALKGTYFSLYLQKAKKNKNKDGKEYKDFGLMKQHLNRFSKTEINENIEIQYFEFIGNLNE